MAKSTQTLEAILSAQVSKGDKEKAMEEVAKTVKVASRAARTEFEAAEDAVESAKEHLAAVKNNPSSTLSQIVNADRAITVAQANVEALKAAREERFGA
jgi:Zn-dependent metalloprotease